MAHYLIIGYGGIGKALTDQLLQANHQVSLVTRQSVHKPSNMKMYHLDLCQENDSTSLIRQLASVPDVIINTIGMLHQDDKGPEKTFKSIDNQWLMENFRINVCPSIYLVKALSAKMNRHSAIKFLSISARVSSLSDNHLGGWYSYRMSKAALNMFIKNVSIEWSRLYPKSIIAAYHPGTVDTHLSKPFQKNIPPAKLFSPHQAAEYFLNAIDDLQLLHSGCLIDWQGEVIAY